MNILVVNDDGISAPGIHFLAEKAKHFGSVTVVAPDSQCSAMSQKLTIKGELLIRKHSDFRVSDVDAYSVSGTPADCVKLAVRVLGLTPDIVFSGINKGYNIGLDIAYSGTIGASFEAIQLGIPAIAFSTSFFSDYEIAEYEIDSVIKELLSTPISKNEIFSVNFPKCTLAEYHGIKRDVPIAPEQYYIDRYESQTDEDGVIHAYPNALKNDAVFHDDDIAYIEDNFTTISRIRNTVLRGDTK